MIYTLLYFHCQEYNCVTQNTSIYTRNENFEDVGFFKHPYVVEIKQYDINQ